VNEEKKFQRWKKGVRIHKVRGQALWLLVDHTDRGSRRDGSIYVGRNGQRSAVYGEFKSLAAAKKDLRSWTAQYRKDLRDEIK